MQSNTVANDDPHGMQGEPIFADQGTYWVLTDTEGGRANYETAEPGQFVITVSDDYYNESVFMQVFLYSRKTKYMAKKLAEFNGNRSEKRKEKYTILRKTTIQKMIEIKWKLNAKMTKRMNQKIMLLERIRNTQKYSVLQTSSLQCHIFLLPSIYENSVTLNMKIQIETILAFF